MESNGLDYYEYVLFYTNEALVISQNGDFLLRERIWEYFKIKEEFIGTPEIYLSRRLFKVIPEKGFQGREFASKQHVRAAIDNIDGYLKEKNIKFPVKAETPIKTSYQTELDTSPELKSEDGA